MGVIYLDIDKSIDLYKYLILHTQLKYKTRKKEIEARASQNSVICIYEKA